MLDPWAKITLKSKINSSFKKIVFLLLKCYNLVLTLRTHFKYLADDNKASKILIDFVRVLRSGVITCFKRL